MQSCKSTDIIIALFKSLTPEERKKLLPTLCDICEEDIENEKTLLRNKVDKYQTNTIGKGNICIPKDFTNDIGKGNIRIPKDFTDTVDENAKYKEEHKVIIRQDLVNLLAKFEKIMDFSLIFSKVFNDKDKAYATEATKYLNAVIDFCEFRKPYKFVIISNGIGLYNIGDMPRVALLEDVDEFRCAYNISNHFHNRKLSENMETWNMD